MTVKSSVNVKSLPKRPTPPTLNRCESFDNVLMVSKLLDSVTSVDVLFKTSGFDKTDEPEFYPDECGTVLPGP